MTGDQGIIKTRTMGYKPNVVYIHTDSLKFDALDQYPMCSMPDLVIRPAESVEHLDLRFLIGLTCCIYGLDFRRVTAVANACKEAKAKRVIANFHKKINTFGGAVTIVIDRIEDTAGHLEWESTEW